MDASFRSLMGAWIVQASICGCVCVFASHITGWRFFIFSPYLLQLSSKVLWSILTRHRQSRLTWEIFSDYQGRFPFDQKFRDFRSKIEWNGKNSGKSFRKFRNTFCTLFDGISGTIENFVFHSQEMSGLVSLPSVSSRGLISFPDFLWTKPKARSGNVRKFLFLDWLIKLTPVQSLLWTFTRFSAANLNVSNVTNRAQSG